MPSTCLPIWRQRFMQSESAWKALASFQKSEMVSYSVKVTALLRFPTVPPHYVLR